MTNHPYPEHVVEAVQKQMDWAGSTAQVALQALWDASRVDTPDELDKLADEAIVHDGYFHYEKDVHSWLGGIAFGYIPSYEMSVPAHVIYWGDTDE